VRLRCFLKEIRGERSLRDITAHIEESTGHRLAPGDLSRIEQGIWLPKDELLPALVAAYGANVDDWYPDLVLLALETDDDKLLSIRARLRTTLLPKPGDR
jgi:transcriptional regulator with XRE-family HTH domain